MVRHLINGDIPANTEFKTPKLGEVSYRADCQGHDRSRLGMFHVRRGSQEKPRFDVHRLKATVNSM